MLVLARKLGERIVIGNNIVVVVKRIADGSVRLGIEAPPEVEVWRQEIVDARADEANADAELVLS